MICKIQSNQRNGVNVRFQINHTRVDWWSGTPVMASHRLAFQLIPNPHRSEQSACLKAAPAAPAIADQYHSLFMELLLRSHHSKSLHFMVTMVKTYRYVTIDRTWHEGEKAPSSDRRRRAGFGCCFTLLRYSSWACRCDKAADESSGQSSCFKKSPIKTRHKYKSEALCRDGDSNSSSFDSVLSYNMDRISEL